MRILEFVLHGTFFTTYKKGVHRQITGIVTAAFLRLKNKKKDKKEEKKENLLIDHEPID